MIQAKGKKGRQDFQRRHGSESGLFLFIFSAESAQHLNIFTRLSAKISAFQLRKQLLLTTAVEQGSTPWWRISFGLATFFPHACICPEERGPETHFLSSRDVLPVIAERSCYAPLIHPAFTPRHYIYIFGSTFGSSVPLITMKLDARDLRYVSTDEFKVLSAVCLVVRCGVELMNEVETGSRNHEVIPTPLIAQISGLRGGNVNKALGELAKRNLVARVQNAKCT